MVIESEYFEEVFPARQTGQLLSFFNQSFMHFLMEYMQQTQPPSKQIEHICLRSSLGKRVEAVSRSQISMRVLILIMPCPYFFSIIAFSLVAAAYGTQ